jgi:hypothetical protein
MTPTETGTGSSLRHGSMADPTGVEAAYDGETVAGRKSSVNTALTLELPYDASPSATGRPIVITKGESLLDAERTALCTPSQRICMAYLETLTVLDAPPGDVFRPPLYGVEKPLIAASSFDDSFLSAMLPLAGAMSWTDAVDATKTPLYAEWIAYRNGRQAWRSKANYQTTDGYDGSANEAHYRAMLKLSEETNNPTEAAQKEQLARGLAQRGIDLYYMHKAGIGWYGQGGFNSGKLPTIVIAASLLQQTSWLTDINSKISTFDGRAWFAEASYIQPATGIGKNIPLFGNLSMTIPSINPEDLTYVTCAGVGRNCADIGGYCVGKPIPCRGELANFEGEADGDPLGDSSSPTNYQACCTHTGWLSSAMTVWMNPRIENNWPSNASHFLTYMDRVRTAGVTLGSDFGTYADKNNYVHVGYDSQYDIDEAYEAWNTYKACAEARTCTGLGPE